jgi:hypothetical protein
MVPNLFLIPSMEWRSPTALFRDRDYGEGLKSAPEWGMNISKKNMSLLEPYSFEKTAESIIERVISESPQSQTLAATGALGVSFA